MKKWVALPVGALLALLLLPKAFAAEGMWPLSNLPVAALQQRFGFTPSAQWVQHVQLASVRLAGGCSGSFVSPDGLVLSNHHCAVECVEGLSSPGRNLMGQSFYAATRQAEPKCPAMEVEQLVHLTDVTATVDRATQGKSGAAYTAAQRAATSKLETACVSGKPQMWRCEVVALYHGGQDWLYKYRRYQDVRLVFVPSQSTSFFGGYPDNFNFPRYDFDVSIMRVYVDGKPAHTPDYFPVSATGPKAGELVFTSGNPGGTERDDTLAQLQALRYPIFPDILQVFSHMQGLLEAFSAESAGNARIARGDLFFIDNAIKSFDGQLEALNEPQAFARKAGEEAALRAKVQADPALAAKVDGAWDQVAAAQTRFNGMFLPYVMLVIQNGQGFVSRLYDIAFPIVLGAYERTLPDTQRFEEYRSASLPLLEQQLFSPAPVYPGYDKLRLTSSLTLMRDLLGSDAPVVKKLFATASPAEIADRAVGGTKLADIAVRKALWAGGQKAVAASSDPMIALAREALPYYLKARKAFEDEVKAPIEANTTKIARARFALYGTSISPDATFTERLSYGVVKGWDKDGRNVDPFTTVKGLYPYARSYDPYELSKAWLAARDRLNPATPFNFVSTNDIVGGNSGSPVIDRDAHLVGLIFDGNLPSLGGSFWYDGTMNRAVAVDSAILLDALQNVYHADALAKELSGRG
ncbi:MAG TPA: S46 family peptidase [Steroidobacteraceae bacterium]|nr:S46 family peptidase [Steroidobacteraceae bacterium]